jgi:hypothetical protein
VECRQVRDSYGRCGEGGQVRDSYGRCGEGGQARDSYGRGGEGIDWLEIVMVEVGRLEIVMVEVCRQVRDSLGRGN